MSGIELLYKNFGILADAEEKDINQHASSYEGIISATKGSVGEKKLAPNFITKFFRHFPSFHEAATDAILDLIEDEDPQIRRLAIKSLPDICKGASDDSLYVRVCDVLTQLLPIEDSTDLGLVKTSMATVLQMNTKLALVGIFDQITGEDEAIREKGLEYISGPLMSMGHKLFTQHPENEQVLLELVKKVLVDVTGEEFEMLMELLSKLPFVSTPEGSQQLSSLISNQAELTAEFKPDEAEFIDKFITCYRQALRFCKFSSSVFPFFEYLCARVLPVLDKVKEEQTRQEMMHLMAESCLRPVEKDVAVSCITPIFDYMLEQLPHPPDAGEVQPKLQFSTVECTLFAFHKFCQHVPEFITADDNASRLKDFRLRLQYFSRGSQAYHAQLNSALKGKTAADMKDEQNKLRAIALKTTANINTLIKDFFYNPPSFKTSIVLSWDEKVKYQTVPQLQQRKRVSGDHELPSKRRPSPIRFEATSKELSKKDSVSIYSPPKDKFSKIGSAFIDYPASRTSKRGGRDKKGVKGSWRE